jgi:predicted  nucleic acid-binding Zn-ribbon protein
LAKLKQQREELLHSVSPQDLKLYERLRQEKKGVAVVNLHGSTCAGCHLELPASDIDKVYAEPYWRCPHCQRIIVRTGERK